VSLEAIFTITAKVKDEGVRRLGEAIGGLSKQSDAAKRGFKGMVDSAAWQGAAVAAAAISAGLVLSVKSAIAFESSMSDVRKVVDGLETPEALANIRAEIMGLSEVMPIAASGFADIYAAAGEAGIARDEIKAFAVDVAQMAVAFGMTAEEAGSGMAKIRTALSLSQPQVQLLGDAMNHLSNNMASNAPQLVDFVKRTGAMGQQAGFTATQTAALGSAMIAAGAESDVAATSFMNMARALTRGESMTSRQQDALFRLGLASRSAVEEEKRLSDAVERESERRMEQARAETNAAQKEISRRYRDMGRALQDGWDDEAEARSRAADRAADATVRGLEQIRDKEIEALSSRQGLADAARSAQEQAIRESYQRQIDQVQDAARQEGKVLERAARDRQQVIKDSLEDRQELEIKATEDRFREIEKLEKQNAEDARARARVAAEAISKEAGATLARRMQADAEGTLRDVFTRINALPKDMQTSVISDLFGEEARALPSLINNMALFEQALSLVAKEMQFAGSYGKEFAVRMQTTAADIQLAQNKIQNLLITLAEEGGLLDAITAIAGGLGQVIKAITTITNAVPGLTPLIVGLSVAFVGLVAALPAIAALVQLAPTIKAIGIAMGASKLGVWFAGLRTIAIVAVPAIIQALSGMLAWIGGTLVPGILAFMGPVGWTVLAVAAVVAMAIAFRKPLMDFVAWLWNWGEPIRKFWIDLWYAMGAAVQLQIRGIQSAWSFLSSGIVTAAVKVRDFVVGIWTNLGAAVSSMWKGVINGIISGINAAIDRINQMVRGANRIAGIAGVSIPELSRVPYLAEGGYITRPTLAMVGEGMDSEYVIPEGKMAAAAQRYMAGQRGTSVLQAGGIIRQSATGAAGAGSGGLVVNPGQASINITTGPVQQLPNGEKAITIADLEMVARQVANQIYAGLRTPAGRRAIGVR
jgi:TP901 family phage tail tape measure protein